jgi:hypothetical protein
MKLAGAFYNETDTIIRCISYFPEFNPSLNITRIQFEENEFTQSCEMQWNGLWICQTGTDMDY